MATTVERSADTQPERKTGAARNFETWSWFFMRTSGLALVFLALLHFAITHIINDVAETGIDFVGTRWENPLWRLYDWLLLALGLAHGVNGIRWIIDDYIRHELFCFLAKGTIVSGAALFFLIGTFTIVTF